MDTASIQLCTLGKPFHFFVSQWVSSRLREKYYLLHQPDGLVLKVIK